MKKKSAHEELEQKVKKVLKKVCELACTPYVYRYTLETSQTKETKYRPEEDISANITIQNKGDIEYMDISLYYAIKDFEGDISLIRTVIRCLIVSFLSFSLGLIIYESGVIAPEVIIPEKTSVVETDFDYVSMLALFILPYLILIFAPIWLLRDSGLVCAKSNVKKEKRETPDIEGVYRYYNSVITGYTGIGFVFTLIILIVDRLEKLDPGSGETTDIPGILLTPFLIAFLIFPAMIFYEYRLKNMKTKLLQKLEKGNLRTIESIKEIL